jgi:hypothetical protein
MINAKILTNKIEILDLVEKLKIKTKKTGSRIFIKSFNRDEKNFSVLLNKDSNLFYDFGDKTHGDVIQLYQNFKKVSFFEALKDLTKIYNISNNFNNNLIKKDKMKNKKSILLRSKILQDDNLINYLKKRCINIEVARIFCDELHFKKDTNIYKVIGFKNDSSGYECRSIGKKFSYSNKDITTLFKDDYFKKLNIFEGFIDFLSFLTHFQIEQTKGTTLVLNSLSMFDKLASEALYYNMLNNFLDNDLPAIKYNNYLNNIHPKVVNYNKKIFKNNKDFNDFLCNNA